MVSLIGVTSVSVREFRILLSFLCVFSMSVPFVPDKVPPTPSYWLPIGLDLSVLSVKFLG